MRITALGDGYKFSLTGECPYDGVKSVFMMVGEPYAEQKAIGNWSVVAAMRCQGCLKYILGLASKTHTGSWEYEAHYPLGSPDDSVDPAVPRTIAADFSEALRCCWVKSFKATVAMCRRSVEASCQDLDAKGKNLKEKINDLAANGRITEPLKEMAHKVRLTANEELHGKPDDLDAFTETDAEGIVAFVREYFHHVYVMPEKLANYGKPKALPE